MCQNKTLNRYWDKKRYLDNNNINFGSAKQIKPTLGRFHIYGAPSRTRSVFQTCAAFVRHLLHVIYKCQLIVEPVVADATLVGSRPEGSINKVGFIFMARPAGLEPATHRLEICCSIQLSHGRICRRFYLKKDIIANCFFRGLFSLYRHKVYTKKYLI